jgi:hypothetical protein
MYCEDASFDLFSRPPTEVGLQEFTDQEILPLTAVSDSATTVEFQISGDGDEYIDMSELRLCLQVKVENVAADDKVKLIKYWPQALFRQCDLFLNGTMVTTSSSMYAYNAYVSSVLSFPKAVKQDQLDVLEHANGWDVKKDDPESEAMIRLHAPICNQQRLLPNKVGVHLRLLRSADAFVIQKQDAADTVAYKISLKKCSLFIRRVTQNPSLLLEHAEMMGKMNCLYPIDRVWPKFYTLQQGIREFVLPNISLGGQLPNRIVVGLVETAAFSGSSTTNPFKFEPFNLDSIGLQCNGRAYPSVPLTTDFNKKFCRRAYHLLLDSTQGPCVDNESIGLSLKNYTEDSCFFGFTLARALTGPSEALPRRDNGYVNAKIQFHEALSKNVNAIFFLEYNNFIEIDSARNIYMDYAA